jgi:GNAT superfamily N-acetyltransferase
MVTRAIAKPIVRNDRETLAFRALTPARWNDFESVFRAKGCSVARGCWCVFYRVSGDELPAPPAGVPRAERNRLWMKSRVDAREFIGLIAYRGDEPVGWISFGPRAAFRKLERSPVMKPVDERAVWSVICFVVPGALRGQGIARALLAAAIDHARRKRVPMLEAYPVDRTTRGPDDALWFGTRAMFADAGFVEVARRKPRRPIMRLALR